jgi:YVTN family beta-propeller protein
VIDPSSNTVVDTVRVGSDPVQAVLAPKGTTAYVLNSGAGTVSVVNTSTNSVTEVIRQIITSASKSKRTRTGRGLLKVPEVKGKRQT